MERFSQKPRIRNTFVMLCVTVVTVFGCNNPFATGTPEPPGGGLVNYPQPTSLENVLEILALALQAEDNPAYLERLSDSFRFIPDAVQLASPAFRNFPAEWTGDHEEAFLAGLLSNADSVFVTWENILALPAGETSTATADYELTVVTQSGERTEYRGQVEITARQTAGVWNIETWRDVLVSGYENTWGLLRAMLLATG
jgi:hypothetical protein